MSTNDISISKSEIMTMCRDFEKKNGVDIYWDYEPWQSTIWFSMRKGKFWGRLVRHIPYTEVTKERIAKTLDDLYLEIQEKQKEKMGFVP